LTKPSKTGTYQQDVLLDTSWVEALGKFEVIQEQAEIDGYQVYAVEKWQVGW
jgi:hypothetical protein